MRFLKKKIAKAKEFLALKNQQIELQKEQEKNNQTSFNKGTLKISTISPTSQIAHRTPETILSTKNIAKNFGKAICSFATSKLAQPYLIPFLEQESLKEKDFIKFIERAKDGIEGLFSFRRVLLSSPNDSDEVLASKRVFVRISEVFIKYFSINWIFHGKVFHKIAHVNFRFKMLRRIQCPELFTYLRTQKKKF